jgi:catechol 2,3-dioxygenase-like lactoylglutathione lyase family enzyme
MVGALSKWCRGGADTVGRVIGSLHSLVLDCPDARALARFYELLLGLERVEDTDSWVTIEGRGQRIAFQSSQMQRPATWGDASVPQQIHVDVLVTDLDQAEAQVIAIGAELLEGSDKPIGYRVYADPAGHPFCLVTPESLVPPADG